MDKVKLQNIGLLLTRLILVFIFIFHGQKKALGGIPEKFVVFPGFFAPLVGWIEILAAIVLLIGIMPKLFEWSNYVLAVIIVVAIATVQIPMAAEAGKLLTAGLERDLLIVAANLALAWTGPGSIAWMKK